MPSTSYPYEAKESAMRKQAPVIDWIIADDDADWERRRILPLPESEPATKRHRPLMRYFWNMAALFLLLAGAGGWEWRPPQDAWPQSAADATVMAQAALGAVAPGRETLVASVIDDQTNAGRWLKYGFEDFGLSAPVQNAEATTHLDIVLQKVEVQGDGAVAPVADQAVARVVTTSNQRPYRQTVFYRRTAAGWQQAYPDTLSWGPERHLETPSFVFHFRQYDAAAVIAVAPQVEALYRTMRQNLGLEHAADGEKLIVEVSMTQSPGNALPWFGTPKKIMAPSPARYRAPLELTDSELLAQSLALPLFEHVLVQAHRRHPIPITWQPLKEALRLWQLWDLDLPLAAWRADVVRWIYSDLPTGSPGQPVVLPPRYRELCAAHTIWLLSPVQIHVPLYCTFQDQDRYYFYWREGFDPPVRLAQLAAPLDREVALSNEIPPISLPDQTIALATLIEYAVATYGRDRLPVLVASLGQHNSWETLVPAVFGVSAAEFEAGWQAYLVAYYGVPLPSPFGH